MPLATQKARRDETATSEIQPPIEHTHRCDGCEIALKERVYRAIGRPTRKFNALGSDAV